MKSRFQLVMVMAMCALLGACTTLHHEPDWQSSVHVGDKIRVTTAPDGASVQLKVVAVSAAGLQGKKRGNAALINVPAERISSVAVRKVSVLKTAGLVVGITTGVVILAVGALAAVGPAFVMP